MKKLTFEDLPGALELALEKLTQIEHKLADLKEYFEPKEPVELMTRNDVAEYLKVDLSTLWNWTNKGKLTAYGIGARVYYKRNEIEQCLIKFNK
jgi:excisionase family DNA binding protein